MGMVRAALSVVAGFTVVTLLFWSPLLAITRLRELFRWPTNRLVVSYPLIGSVLLAAQSLSYLVVMLLTAGTGTVTGGDAVGIVGGVLAVNLLFPSTLALVVLRVLPERCHRTPTGDGQSPRLALGIGVVWYGIVTSVGFVLIGLVVTFANLPM
ncbi:hypothetical protein [Haloferax volcanii]|uniref:hypothetical protein n=1 Tax=Haloferax volcanii TaxID=2246 RepID=UPI0034E0D216